MAIAAQKVVGTLAVGGLLLGSAAFVALNSNGNRPGARADVNVERPGMPTTVSNDVLPSPQIDGVAWSVRIAGDKAFVGGNFTKARPFGAAPGTLETPRNHLLAFDLKTGKLIDSFAPVLNSEVRTMAVSEDGKSLYVGGAFSKIGDANVYRVAKFNTETLQRDTAFNVSVDARVTALTVKNNVLYAGGAFSAAHGQRRARLASFDADTGKLRPWNPSVNNAVNGIAVSPDNNSVVIGGNFTTMNGATTYGIGMVDAAAGASKRFDSNKYSPQGIGSSGYFDVRGDNEAVYASAWSYASGTPLESILTANWSDGSLRTISAARGDTYGIAVQGDVLYTTGHMHEADCIGGMVNYTEPFKWQRAVAFTKNKSPFGRVNRDCAANQSGKSLANLPAPELIHWWPEVAAGTFTGQNQGGWTLDANADYLVMGGEFPRLNGIAQQGIALFGRKGIAPLKDGPKPGAELEPQWSNTGRGRVKVSFRGLYDRDSYNVTYELLRNNEVVSNTVISGSTWWKRPNGSVTDLAPNGTHTYRLRVRDADGAGFMTAPWTTTVTDGISLDGHAGTVYKDGGVHLWRMNNPKGTRTIPDAFIGADLNVSATAASGLGMESALPREAGGSIKFTRTDLATPGVAATADDNPQNFAIEAWLKSSSTQGGTIVTLGDTGTGMTGSSDRLLVMDNAGKLTFATWPGRVVKITSAKSYNDGQWHHVVANHSSQGLELYVDGERVANTAESGAEVRSGRWRVGGGANTGFGLTVAGPRFEGQLDEVAIYKNPLTQAKVLDHYAVGLNQVNGNFLPLASFTTAINLMDAKFDATASTDRDGQIVSYAWDFGDGTTATGIAANKTYAKVGNYNVTLAVTDDKGAVTKTTQQVAIVGPNAAPVAAFAESIEEATVTVDASASKDPDGSIASYSWDFGDGSTAAGVKATRTYATTGTYTVTLTVTDNRGAKSTLTRSVVVTVPPPAPECNWWDWC